MATRRITSSIASRIVGGSTSICMSSRAYIIAQCRQNSTTSAPTLSRLRPDLKIAMQTKDKTRLSVLRGILALVADASRSGKPVDNDAALLALFKKELKAVHAARAQAEEAGRPDLVQAQDKTISVLKEYSGMVDIVSEEEIRAVVTEIIQKLQSEGQKTNVGNVMSAAKEKLTGKPVEMSELAKVITAAIS